MIAPVMARANWVVDNPAETTLELDYRKSETLDRWSWCDALFMAPPVYAKLYALTQNKKYLDFMNQEYKVTYDFLYDKDEQLFYRDWRYFGKKEANSIAFRRNYLAAHQVFPVVVTLFQLRQLR